MFATSSISPVTSIQQNLLSKYTPIHLASSESSNKRSRGQSSWEKMEEIWEIAEIKEFKQNSQKHKRVWGV